MKVAVLAVQGAFIEHEKMLSKFGVKSIELRQLSDLNKEYDALILPGGESTVQGKLLKEQCMIPILKKQISEGLPVLGTCAGLILLAQNISNDEHSYLGTLPVSVKRNAYGRQLGSFYTEGKFGNFEKFPMEFIRAPYIEKASDKCKILATVDDKIVGVQYQKQIGIAFHPELTCDTRIHEMLLKLI